MEGVSRNRMEGVELGATSGGNVRAERLGLRDQKESSREAKFGDVWKDMQAKYGAKPEKPREIKKTLGKDDFMKIMVTQMQHQDPTQPFKAEQFAQELAQYASVEQLQNMNTSMGKLLTTNQPLERLAMTGMIGKTVTVDRERFVHTEGQPEALKFVLPKPAKEVKVAVLNEMGEILFEKDLGGLSLGEQTFSWDGVRSNTMPAKTGNYMIRIAATDDKGAQIQTNSQSTATVIGVGFEGQEPALLVGNPQSPDKILMRSVVRVQETMRAPPQMPALGQLGGSPQAALSAEAAVTPEAPVTVPISASPSLITFEKGVGSNSISPNTMDPRVRAAFERASGKLEGVGLASNEDEKPSLQGFPNGLSNEGGEKE